MANEFPVPQLLDVTPFATPVSSPFSTPQKPAKPRSVLDETAFVDGETDASPPISPRSAALTNPDQFYNFVDESILASLENNAKYIIVGSVSISNF